LNEEKTVTLGQTPAPQEDMALAEQADMLRKLPPLADQIVDKAIDNMTRKLVAGYRNKRNAKPNAKSTDYVAETKETLAAVSAESVMEVANRGQAWKEMIQKSLTAGISSIHTIQFEGEFRVQGGKLPDDFSQMMPDGPGVYVVYAGEPSRPVYVGDSDNMQRRWHAGHINEHRQAQRTGQTYKLGTEFEEGCTVKFIRMESKETAAALEAHLIRENFDQLKNQRQELETEQGTRSNQEAQKLKDAAASTASLVKGAAGEGLKNVGFDVLERLTTAMIKAVKTELVDILHGTKTKIAVRVRRVVDAILSVLKGILDNPLQLLRGIVEFVVNALSKAIGQIYNLARNIFDVVHGAWKLYQGSATMSREELVRKISETVIVSGSLVLWDGLDPIIEAQLAMLGPFAPYVSCAVVAIGFGLTSYALQGFVTKAIDAIVAFRMGLIQSVETARAACEQMLENAERELAMLADLREYLATSVTLMDRLATHAVTLSQHQAIQPLDIRALLSAPTDAHEGVTPAQPRPAE
jgi:hypothetical protein